MKRQLSQHQVKLFVILSLILLLFSYPTGVVATTNLEGQLKKFLTIQESSQKGQTEECQENLTGTRKYLSQIAEYGRKGFQNPVPEYIMKGFDIVQDFYAGRCAEENPKLAKKLTDLVVQAANRAKKTDSTIAYQIEAILESNLPAIQRAKEEQARRAENRALIALIGESHIVKGSVIFIERGGARGGSGYFLKVQGDRQIRDGENKPVIYNISEVPPSSALHQGQDVVLTAIYTQMGIQSLDTFSDHLLFKEWNPQFALSLAEEEEKIRAQQEEEAKRRADEVHQKKRKELIALGSGGALYITLLIVFVKLCMKSDGFYKLVEAFSLWSKSISPGLYAWVLRGQEERGVERLVAAIGVGLFVCGVPAFAFALLVAAVLEV